MNNQDKIFAKNPTEQLTLSSESKVDDDDDQALPATESTASEINWQEPNYDLPTPPPITDDDIITVPRPKGEIADKLTQAAPYNFFLTTVTDSEQTHNERLSVTFQGLYFF